jgi:hypothetical protein
LVPAAIATLGVSKYTREGKRKGSNSEHATHHQNDEYGFTQKALPSFDRRLDNLFALPLHIPSKVCFPKLIWVRSTDHHRVYPVVE